MGLEDRALSFNPLFTKALGAAPGRLHFAAHSHHLWPDASFEGQIECWEDAAARADHKWDKIMGEVWPEAQARVATELGSGDPSAIVFASNTHDFLIRLATAAHAAPAVASSAFVLGGGYKYAMAGEGMGFMLCPPGYGERPAITGWFAEFGELTAPPGSSVGYTRDAMRFMGATFDSSALYRFNAIQRMLTENGLTTGRIAAQVANLQAQFLGRIAGSALDEAELLNPLDDGPHARFLAFRSSNAQRWCSELEAQNIVTDVRGDVLRIGFGLYQDEDDVDALAGAARQLA